MTSKSSFANPSRALLSLQKTEHDVNKRLADTQAEIAGMKTRLAALKQYKYEEDVICERVLGWAEEKGVSFNEMMTQYALNRLATINKKLVTRRDTPVSA
jgi:hypothetical protein